MSEYRKPQIIEEKSNIEKTAEKLPAIFAHIVNNYFSVVSAILENEIPHNFLEKMPLKNFKDSVMDNFDRGVINEEQVKELFSRPDFIEEYDNFINKFQKIISENKLIEKQEELTKEMNNILNKIEK
ncbi:MAG: hypothetical protein WC414_00220 [Patescibacteria group bacterium]